MRRAAAKENPLKKLTFGLAAAVALGLSRTNPPEAVKEDFARRRDALDEAAASMDARVQAEDKRADAADLAAKIAIAATADKSNAELVIASGRQTGKSLAMAELQERIFFKPAMNATAKTRRPGENRKQHRARMAELMGASHGR